MRKFRRPRDKYDDPTATEFMWGVPRREGHSDTDDPAAHSGVMQHAFEFGRDDRAMCGFEPPKRSSRAYRDARPQLAVAGRDNPKCRKCELLVASRVRGEEAVPVMGADARNGRPAEAVETDLEANTEEVVFVNDPAPAPEHDEQPAAELEETASDDQPATENAQGTKGEQTAEIEETTEGEQASSFARATELDHEPGQPDPAGLDSPSRARDPDFHPRGQIERGRRRSVRRGGTVLVGPGRRSVVIDVPVSTDIAGIVANVEPEIEDVRVEAVTVGNDGTARISLNRPAPAAVAVAWYIVSNPFRDSA